MPELAAFAVAARTAGSLPRAREPAGRHNLDAMLWTPGDTADQRSRQGYSCSPDGPLQGAARSDNAAIS